MAKNEEVTVDFAGVESGGQYVRVPEADYHFKVAKATLRKAKETENPYIETFAEIMKGEQKGKKLRETFSLTKQSLWKLRGFLEACGKQVPSKAVKINVSKMVGWEFAGTTSDDEYEGKKKSIISSFFPVSELGKSSGAEALETAGEGSGDEPPEEAEELFS
jgi:hypothetical protein